MRRPSYKDLFNNPGLGLLLTLKIANDPETTYDSVQYHTLFIVLDWLLLALGAAF
jgi:hypothetical protein